MSEGLAHDLAAFRKRRLEEGLARGNNEIPQWAFASSSGTAIDVHGVERRELERVLAAAGYRKIRFRGLRNTCATLLLIACVSVVQLKEHLGHASIQITGNKYVHWIPGTSRQAVNAISDLKSAPRDRGTRKC